MKPFRIGVDIGGTFTDFTLFDDGARTVRTHKRLTTPADPSRAVLDGCVALTREAGLGLADVEAIVHGTTLVTNAVIERKGVPTAMLVTRGFRDLLDIAEERRYDLFDLTIRYPQPVVPRRLRCEVSGRLRYDGSEIEPLGLDGVDAFLDEAIADHAVQAVAICFLHSYANSSHESEAACHVAERYPDLAVSTSSGVFPFAREYPRWTTTCLNAYVQPVVDRYLARLEASVRSAGFAGRLLVMGSSGGTLTPEVARRYPIRLLESGPAAGALMSARHGRELGFDQVLSFDMGGTTAKGCIIRDGKPLRRYGLEVARVHEFKRGSGLPVKVPVLDMIEIGAGGGSIASIDARRLLSVGPTSAGADPGPACYGLGGTYPTLTDANLLLGFLDPGSFLGGEMTLDVAAAREVVRTGIAEPLGIDVEHAASGIHEVISEEVARAFRVHASEQGVDCRRCTMVVFGGSGPLHGTAVARKLRIPRVVCPVGAGVMSAFGLLTSPLAFETVRSRRIPLGTPGVAELASDLGDLGVAASSMLFDAGIGQGDVRLRRRIDMRYAGQGHEVEVEAPDGEPPDADLLRKLFEDQYESVFGLRFAGRPIEIVNWKVEAEGPAPGAGDLYKLVLDRSSRPALKGHRPVWSPEAGGIVPQPVYDRYGLAAGASLEGPALIEERESTCVLGAGDRLRVDAYLNLVIEIPAPRP